MLIRSTLKSTNEFFVVRGAEVDFIEPVMAQAGSPLTLISILPLVCVVEFPGLGHMGPITHSEVVNAEIARFLAEVEGSDQRI